MHAEGASSAGASPPVSPARGAVPCAVLTAVLVEAGAAAGRGEAGPGVATTLGAALVLAAGWWLGVGVRPAAPGAPPGREPRWVWALPPVALALSLATNPAARASLGAPVGLLAWALLGLALAALPWAFPRRGGAVALAAAVGAGLALRGLTFAASELSTGGDMIPLAHRAAGNFLRGQSPYATYFFPWALPLTYLPGTWLPFAGARALGLHPRLVNVAAELALAAVLLAPALRRGRGAGAVAPLWATVFLAPAAVEWARITTAPVGWAALGALLVALAREGRAGAPLLGLALGTTPLAAPLVPFALLAWRRRHGTGGALRRALVALGVAAAILLPFALWAPRPFFEGTILWFGDLDRFPRLKWRETRVWAQNPGLGGLAWTLGLERLLAPLQALLVGGAAVLFARRAPARAVPPFAAAALLLFAAFNAVNWPYLYQPALVAALAAARGFTPRS